MLRRTTRPGFSLMEVVVALFVMALGIICLFTLFPLGAEYSYEFLSCPGSMGLVLHITVQRTPQVARAHSKKIYVRKGAQNIEVKNVQVTNIKGKEKRFGRFMGRRSNWKKAYVSIKNGQEINFSEIAQGEVK